MLSEKITNINQRAEEEKLNKREAFFKKITAFHEKVKQKVAAQDIQFKILKEQIDRLNEDLEEERRIREDFEQEMEANIYPVPNSHKHLSLEQISQLVVEREQSARKEIESNISRYSSLLPIPPPNLSPIA